jgi:hypothetical protein
MKVLKKSTCPNLSGNGTICYEVGIEKDRSLWIRLIKSSGGGFHWTKPVPMAAIKEQLEKAKQPFTSYALHGQFAGKSVNTASFLAAVLRAEELIRPDTEKRLSFVCDDLETVEKKLRSRLRKPRKPASKKVAATQ